MVDYVFDSTNSFFDVGRAISDFTAGTVKVKADGHLISTGNFSVVGDLNWSITILGAVGSYAAGKAGIFLGSPSLLNASSLAVGADGDLFGTDAGLIVEHRTNVVNAGSISATTGDAILETANAIGNYKITNSGTIVGVNNGMSLLGAGIHTIVNSGTILGGTHAIFGDDVSVAGIERVTNSGIIETVQLGLGDDVFTNFAKVGHKIKHGTIGGGVDLGAGDDIFNGGKFAEVAKDGPGTDIYKLGAGNDFFIAQPESGASGDDFVNGGKGSDAYIATSAVTGLIINLDTVLHNAALAQHAVGFEIGIDTIIGFENAAGGHGADFIYGNAAANGLSGGGDVDQIFGFAGNDTLIGDTGNDFLDGGAGDDGLDGGDGLDFLVGGAGNDVLKGGLESDTLVGNEGDDQLIGGDGSDALYSDPGKDQMEGDADADMFVFISRFDTGVGAAKRDVILDFNQSEADIIRLVSIDANTATGTDDAFNLIGLAAFSGAAGELRFKYAKGSTIIEGDVNGDAKADFQIELQGHFLLTGADFQL